MDKADITIAVDVTGDPRSIAAGGVCRVRPRRAGGAVQLLFHSVIREKLKSRPPDILIRPAVGGFGSADFFKIERHPGRSGALPDEVKRKLAQCLERIADRRATLSTVCRAPHYRSVLPLRMLPDTRKQVLPAMRRVAPWAAWERRGVPGGRSRARRFSHRHRPRPRAARRRPGARHAGRAAAPARSLALRVHHDRAHRAGRRHLRPADPDARQPLRRPPRTSCSPPTCTSRCTGTSGTSARPSGTWWRRSWTSWCGAIPTRPPGRRTARSATTPPTRTWW